MTNSFNRKYVKVAVDYTAVFLLVSGVVCFLFGLGPLIDANAISGPYGKETANSLYATGSKILSSGVLQIIGGLLLFVGIIKGHRIPVLVYLIFSTIGLVIASCYGLYTVVMSYKGYRSTTHMILIFVAVFGFSVFWWCQVCVFVFYRDLEQEYRQRRTNPAAAAV